MSIADKITSIETHIGDIYDTLELGGADLTNVNKNIVNINSQLKDRYLDYMNNGTQEIWDNWEKVTGEGTSLTLNNTEQAPIKIDLKGNTSQTGTPTPSSPIPVNVVSGDNSVVVCGKNIARQTFDSTFYITGSGDNRKVASRVGDKCGEVIEVKPNTSYAISGTFSSFADGVIRIALFNTMPVVDSVPTNIYNTGSSTTFTTGANTHYVLLYDIRARSVVVNDLQLEVGTSSTTYEPYNIDTYPINLPSDIELCKIGDYQDYFLHDKTLDKWYLHKEIGKVVLDGSEGWIAETSGSYATNPYFRTSNSTFMSTYQNIISNYFIGKNISASTTGGIQKSANLLILQPSNGILTASDFKTWLGTHNTIVYAPLITPTTTEITYQPLIEQLNNLEKAMSYNGQTNISQVNNDLPFIISVSALKKGSV